MSILISIVAIILTGVFINPTLAFIMIGLWASVYILGAISMIIMFIMTRPTFWLFVGSVIIFCFVYR